jgi:hypothetical protein
VNIFVIAIIKWRINLVPLPDFIIAFIQNMQRPTYAVIVDNLLTFPLFVLIGFVGAVNEKWRQIPYWLRTTASSRIWSWDHSEQLFRCWAVYVILKFQQEHSSKADSSSDGEIFLLLWDLKFHYYRNLRWATCLWDFRFSRLPAWGWPSSGLLHRVVW